MAIEYTLYFDTDQSPQRLHKTASACHAQSADVAPAGLLTFSGASLQGVVSAPDDVTRQFISEDFSLDARVQIFFRLDKFEMERAQDSLVRCVSELVSAHDGDLILLFNGELIVLRRKAGDLVLRSGFGAWTPDRLAFLQAPYRVGSV